MLLETCLKPFLVKDGDTIEDWADLTQDRLSIHVKDLDIHGRHHKLYDLSDIACQRIEDNDDTEKDFFLNHQFFC